MAYYALVLCFVVASGIIKQQLGSPPTHTIRECFGCRVVKKLVDLVPKMILGATYFHKRMYSG